MLSGYRTSYAKFLALPLVLLVPGWPTRFSTPTSSATKVLGFPTGCSTIQETTFPLVFLLFKRHCRSRNNPPELLQMIENLLFKWSKILCSSLKAIFSFSFSENAFPLLSTICWNVHSFPGFPGYWHFLCNFPLSNCIPASTHRHCKSIYLI